MEIEELFDEEIDGWPEYRFGSAHEIGSDGDNRTLPVYHEEDGYLSDAAGRNAEEITRDAERIAEEHSRLRA
jgi:hypothetical protein